MLEFQGADRFTLERSGDQVMHTAAGELRWSNPLAYQEMQRTRQLIACNYTRKAANQLPFQVGVYDHSRPVIIDPVLVYSTYLGGSEGDRGAGIALDKNGNIYVTG